MERREREIKEDGREKWRKKERNGIERNCCLANRALESLAPIQVLPLQALLSR